MSAPLRMWLSFGMKILKVDKVVRFEALIEFECACAQFLIPQLL